MVLRDLLHHDGSTRNYGAELRPTDPNVYGNKGAVADGNDCLMYPIPNTIWHT